MENDLSNLPHVPVLIVGGGVTGLSAALFLLQQGVKPLLIEKHQSTSIHPRARGFDTRTMELMRTLGLSETIREAGKSLAPSWGILTGKSLAQALAKKKQRKKEGIKFPSQMKGLEAVAMMSPETGARCTQDLSEPVLLQAVLDRGADVAFHTELLSFSMNEAGTTAVIKDRQTGEQQMINADYMIAADGAGSRIREMLQAKWEGKGSLGHLLNIYFEADLADVVRGREFSILRIDRPRLKGFLSAINNRDRWAFQLHYNPDDGERPEDFTAEKVVSLLQQVIGIDGLKIRVISILPWRPTVKVVKQMQYGRVFLAGDAAHIMTPYGGKGANTGIQDVHNLAWKLSAVLKRTAGEELLKTYDAERRPVGWYNASRSGKMADRFGLLKKPGLKMIWPFLKVMILGKFHLTRFFPRVPLKNLGYLLGLPHYRYASTAVVPDEKRPAGSLMTSRLTGDAGTRMPHLWVYHEGEALSTLDVTGKDFVLFTGEDPALWKRMADTIGEKFALNLRVYSLGKSGTLIFAKSDFRDVFRKISDSGALLVRPDGFVAWKCNEANAHSLQELEHVLAQVLSINNNVKENKKRKAEPAI